MMSSHNSIMAPLITRKFSNNFIMYGLRNYQTLQ